MHDEGLSSTPFLLSFEKSFSLNGETMMNRGKSFSHRSRWDSLSMSCLKFIHVKFIDAIKKDLYMHGSVNFA